MKNNKYYDRENVCLEILPDLSVLSHTDYGIVCMYIVCMKYECMHAQIRVRRNGSVDFIKIRRP
jgi:hypothetical protein